MEVVAPIGRCVPMRTFIEYRDLPVASIAALALREGRRPRPIYGTHKWFARRLGVVFRSLLVSANLRPSADFWRGYYGDCKLNGLTVLDPFVGGGTSVVEARRLGANCVGVDVDPIACAVTSFELEVDQMPLIHEALADLKRTVGEEIQQYHRGRLPSGDEATVLHHFWVQAVTCPKCEVVTHAHPDYILAEDATICWSICACCGEINRRRAGIASMRCSSCGEITSVRSGPGKRGLFTCPECNYSKALIEIAREEKKPPQWHLFAQELFIPVIGSRSVPIAERVFVKTDYSSDAIYFQACEALDIGKRNGSLILPNAPISAVKRADDRITSYGYRTWLDLFNGRQLLHLGLLRQAIENSPAEFRRPLSIAYSNHLTTNCMMAAYAAGWRRLTPLFSVRAFRHIQRPVEINPWVDGTGRGSFPNAVRKLIRAKEFLDFPKEPSRRGGFREVPISKLGTTSVFNRSSQDLSNIPSESIDIVLTDPPYYDNINYSELSEFFSPWMRNLGLTKGANGTRKVLTQSIVARKTTGVDAESFSRGLGAVFREIKRIVKPSGMVVFTYRHTHPSAWECLAEAIHEGGLVPARVFPMPGEAGTGLHTSAGTGLWDAVFVLRPSAYNIHKSSLAISSGSYRRVTNHVRQWKKKLRRAAIPFTKVDALALKSALLVGEALKCPGAREKQIVSLADALTAK